MTAISEILGALSTGIARPNRFKIELPNDDGGQFGILCYACTLPARGIQTFELKQRGVPYKVPFSQDYQPITFSFYATPRLNTRKYFERWHKDVVISYKYNVMGTYTNFARPVKIKMLDQMGEVGLTVSLIEAWPINIGEVDLNYGTNNTYATITVTLSYKYWVSGV